MIVEICANSYESAITAQEGGAHRIELCTDLSVGGLTPSKDLIEKVVRDISIPVHVLVRPRSGDFCYSDEELEVMLSNIRLCKSLGCKGIVSGALHSDNTIDMQSTQKLIDASGSMSFIFHRAIDLVEDPIEAIENLRKLSISGVLSSGQQIRAFDGLPLLKRMRTASKGLFEIMPGGGIQPKDVIAFKNSGFQSVHLSAIRKKTQIDTSISFFDSKYEGASDLELIREVVAISKGKS